MRVILIAAVAAAALCLSCGGGASKSGGTAPTPTPPPSTPTPGTVTITIANNAVSPKSVSVPVGGRVTFVNNDTQSHDMQSDPHPIHTDCPEINQVALISPNQSRQTGVFNMARTCGYHDHNREFVDSLKGTITVN